MVEWALRYQYFWFRFPRLRLLIVTKVPKPAFIPYPKFIDFDQNSQSYVYLLTYVYLIHKSTYCHFCNLSILEINLHCNKQNYQVITMQQFLMTNQYDLIQIYLLLYTLIWINTVQSGIAGIGWIFKSGGAISLLNSKFFKSPSLCKLHSKFSKSDGSILKCHSATTSFSIPA